MSKSQYDCIIVGSGAGGGTLARELSQRGKKVLVLERGIYERQVGTVKDTQRYYVNGAFGPRKSKEGMLLWRAFMSGGTTVVSLANSVRCLQQELADLGVELEEEFVETEQDMKIAPIDKKLLSDASDRIMRAAKETGGEMMLMPKCINPEKCRSCTSCGWGCKFGAKWTVLNYLRQAKKQGAQIEHGITIDDVLLENGKAVGVVGKQNGSVFEAKADKVVLAAGGLATPIILQKAGIKDAGKNLFVDPFVNVYAATDGTLNLTKEPPMSLVELHLDDGYLLSPYVLQSKMARLIECGLKLTALRSNEKVIGMMVKISDESVGEVFPDGTVSKPVTSRDQERFDRGSARAKEILVRAGAFEKSVVITKPQGAHPGGTAAIGKIVDKNFETKIENLYVCDASLLPKSPGLPPIVTIVALAKKLARNLCN